MHAIRLQSKGAKPEYARNVKEVCMSGRQFVGLSICPSVCANMYIYVPVYVKVGKSIFIICMYAICSYVCVYMYTYILLHIYIHIPVVMPGNTVPYRIGSTQPRLQQPLDSGPAWQGRQHFVHHLAS